MVPRKLLWFAVSVSASIVLEFALAAVGDRYPGYFRQTGLFLLGFAFGALMTDAYWVAPIGLLTGQVAVGMAGTALGFYGQEPGHWPLYLTFLLWYLLFSAAGVGAGLLFYRWRTRVV
jgi:hypothetical protein